jgi:glycosyltransferase involved in cell wall biosynthesis
VKNKTLHVDLGGISYWPNEAITGIPRVTLSLAKAISHLGDYRNTRLNLMSLLHDDHKVPGSVLDKFELADVCQDLSSAGGVIFLLDIYYYKYNFLNKLPEEVRRNFTVVDYIHDIIPVTAKNLFDISEFKFKHLIRQAFQFSDAIMTPSKKTVDDIINYIISDDDIKVGEGLKLGFNYHGADFAGKQAVTTIDHPNIALEMPYFLMVGTIEVRKNHLHVLNVFEKLWSQGINATLCIAGRIGWKVEPWVERLGSHPERNKRLFFINEPSDEELARLYTNAYCLIFASIDEGFGLPVVEAAHYKTPLLLSDIAIFREIAGPHARYFSLDDERFLVQAIIDFQRDMSAGLMKEDSSQIKEISWLESAKNILDDIIDDRWYCTIHADKSVEYHND